MKRYEVGRPAIREAMQNLQRMGLISIKHGGRPRVAEPSLELMIEQMSVSMRHVLTHSTSTMDHMKEARVTFESEMARIAAVKHNDASLTRIRRVLARQAGNKDSSSRFLALDGEFHQAIAAASENPIFESLSFALFNWLAEFHTNQVRKPGLEPVTLSEHGLILSAIERGDSQAAGDAMRDHLNRASKLYNNKIS
jgi:DNA-binding FadR family transcriptional regulator